MTTVREDAETPLFKQNFTNWIGKNEVTKLPTARSATAAKGILHSLLAQLYHGTLVICDVLLRMCLYCAVQPKFDVTKMHTKGTRESQHLVDDGSGKVEVCVCVFVFYEILCIDFVCLTCQPALEAYLV